MFCKEGSIKLTTLSFALFDFDSRIQQTVSAKKPHQDMKQPYEMREQRRSYFHRLSIVSKPTEWNLILLSTVARALCFMTRRFFISILFVQRRWSIQVADSESPREIVGWAEHKYFLYSLNGWIFSDTLIYDEFESSYRDITQKVHLLQLIGQTNVKTDRKSRYVFTFSWQLSTTGFPKLFVFKHTPQVWLKRAKSFPWFFWFDKNIQFHHTHSKVQSMCTSQSQHISSSFVYIFIERDTILRPLLESFT